MCFLKKQLVMVKIFIFCVLITSFEQTAQSKSVYAIINHVEDIIGAYKINGDQIEYQIQIQAPQHATRAIDLAIDSDSFCIFVTYEHSNVIEIMNAKTLENEGSVIATGASDLAGIVFDEARQKLYVVDRETYNLFVYLWNATNKTLIPDGTNPKILTDLPTPPGAFGLALDTTDSHLYVTNYTSTIHYYDTNDWSHLGSVNVGQIAVDVDVDSERGYLYAGGYREHPFLLKLDLSTGIAEANNIGAGVIGLAVDPDTGLVYTTTYYGQYGRLRIYDTSTSPFTQTDYEDISAGCGVCIPIGDVSYKPPVFYFEKVDVNEPNCVLPGDYITYEITYGPNGVDHNNVIITDYLPYKVDYILSEPLGDYNDALRTVTWEFEYLDANAPNDTVTLTVKVNLGVEPNGIIANYCEIEDAQYCSYAISDTNACWWSPEIIYADINAAGLGSGLSWYHAEPNLHSALEKAQLWDCNEIWVANGTYYTHTDTNSQYWDVSFELVNGVALYGGFSGSETSRNQRNWRTNKTILEGDINNDGQSDTDRLVTANNVGIGTIIDGFTIRGGYLIGIKIANASVTIKNNNIEENGVRGIECLNQSSADIINCCIQTNGWSPGYDYYGIYDEGVNLTVSNCVIKNNYGDGIHCINLENDSVININNNLICNNWGNGIYLFGTDYVFLPNFMINNSTIAYNTGYGFTCSGDPSIISCILCNNDVNNFNWYEPYEYQYVRYCCVGDTPVYPGVGNKNNDPCFVDANANNYHLDVNSLCIDAGDLNFNPDPPETDIDGEQRIVNGRVDIGADEYYWSPADFDKDELVNFIDYAMFANAWQSSSGQPDYNEIFDLEDDGAIDYDDLALFCDDWLWEAGWNQTIESMMMGMGMDGGMGQSMIESASLTDGLSQSVSAKQQPVQLELLDIEEIMNWLAEVWLDPEIQEHISEADWLEFIETLKSELE